MAPELQLLTQDEDGRLAPAQAAIVAEWHDTDQLPPEAMELLNLLRRWPGVPYQLAEQHATELGGNPQAGWHLLEVLQAQPEDRRRQPYLAKVAGHDVVWVTTAGQRACGTQRRTNAPGLSEIDHTIALSQVAHDWSVLVDRVVDERFSRGLAAEFEYDVTPGASYVTERLGGASFIEESVRFQPAAEIGGGAASTKARQRRAWSGKGAIPDLVVTELWHPLLEVSTDSLGRPEYGAQSGPYFAEAAGWRSRLWPHAALSESVPTWSPLPQRKIGHEVIAVEIERSKKKTALLLDKVAAHAAALEVGAWDCVLWLTDDEQVATAIQRAKTATLHTPFDHELQPIISTATVSPAASRAAVSGLGSFGWLAQAQGRMKPLTRPQSD